MLSTTRENWLWLSLLGLWLSFRAGRGARQPAEDAQAPDVRPRQSRPAPPSRSCAGLMAARRSPKLSQSLVIAHRRSRWATRWMRRYTTDDPETGLSVRKAVYGHTEQEARPNLIAALAARQAGSLLVTRGRELTVGQYAEHWLAGLRKDDLLMAS